MKRRLSLFLVLSAVAFVGAVWTFLLVGGPHQETLDQRVHDVGSQLKCPVCQSESVADSSVLIAQQMRLVIRQQLQEGKSDQEIIQYFEDKYGAQVTWSPPWQGFTLLAWIVPIVLLLGGIGLLFFVLREWQTSAATRVLEPVANKDSHETAPADPDLERYRAQLEEELAQEDALFRHAGKEVR